MIETMHLTKKFRGEGKRVVTAVNDVSLKLEDAKVFGLVGTNGAGKSTLLRILSGVMKQDDGMVCIDREPVYDNPQSKAKLFFVPSDFYFFSTGCPMDMGVYYQCVYDTFDMQKYLKLLKSFNLDPERRISEFSKGMKKQLSILLALSAGTRYVLLDETFDGLDPLVRQAMKSLFANEIVSRGLTPVLSSHNLREIEDICDSIGLLHQGGLLLSSDIEDMKLGMQKIQVVFASEEDRKSAEAMLHILTHESRGRLHTYTVSASREETEQKFRGVPTVFFEVLPLSLEEIFISETEASGYDIRKIILN